VHGLFVLLTTLTWCLPLTEGVRRRSPFWVALFTIAVVLSFAMHCDETGLCSAWPPTIAQRLRVADLAFSWFLLHTMAAVVLDVREEVAARVVGGVLAAGFMARGVADTRFNIVVSALAIVAVFLADWRLHHRRLTASWWRRIALVAGLVCVGALLFRLLRLLWALHGLWHMYVAGATHLLLLAQRRKHELAASAAAAGAGAGAALGGLTGPGGKGHAGANGIGVGGGGGLAGVPLSPFVAAGAVSGGGLVSHNDKDVV
jgi:hypothetical protein